MWDRDGVNRGDLLGNGFSIVVEDCSINCFDLLLMLRNE
jgi:hypothetical protein